MLKARLDRPPAEISEAAADLLPGREGSGSLASPPPRTAAAGRAAVLLADLLELTKPGITFMVVVTAALGFLLGSQGRLPFFLLLGTLAGTALVAGGGSALNHLLERERDGLMRRTADRPLPAGRLRPAVAALWGVGLAAAGLAVLALAVNALTAVLGAVALAGYVGVYTPLKRVTPVATLVGAVPGALPPVMGWAAVRGDLQPAAWVLFGILFLWQLPHFLAIAWLCREDYARAGFPMLPVLDPDGHRTARQMVLYSAALLPVSLLPPLLDLAGAAYFLGAAVLGLAFLGCALAFARSRTSRAAYRLLWASVLYLPGVLAAMMLDRLA